MTDLEKLISLLLAENPNYSTIKIPFEVTEQRRLLRALMNVRVPKPISDEIIALQDKELQEQLAQKGVVTFRGKGIEVWQGDITRVKVDAIVNAANSQMLGCFTPGHQCIDNAIHSASGLQLRQECARLLNGRLAETAEVIVTKAYNLPSKYVLHVTGPIVHSGNPTEEHIQQLRQCYQNCLIEADRLGLESIAFCCISTGVFRFPNNLAANIVVETVQQYLKKGSGTLRKIVFNVFKDNDREIYKKILSDAR